MIDYTPIELINWVLTEEGKQLAKDGSHEARVFAAVPAGEEGLPIAELQVSLYIWIYSCINIHDCANRTRSVLQQSLVKVKLSRTSGSPRRVPTWFVWSILLLIKLKMN